MMRCLALGVVLLPLAGASAAPLDTAGATQCQTRGFSIDTDPKGTNVRSAPRADASILRRLPPLVKIGPDTVTGVEFVIVGSKDGWLLIEESEQRGWISGRLVGTTLASRPLRAAPRRDAPVVAQLSGENWGPDSVGVSAVHACSDKYVEVTARPLGGKPLRGWSYWPCSNQLTTCDRSDAND